jgi:hypothetical protein
LLERSDEVLDIREQFPLLEYKDAMEMAKMAGIAYPTDNASKFPYILTTDFMIDTFGGQMARTVKLSKDLNNLRTLEKLEIERRYWGKRGIDWKITTEKEIDLPQARAAEKLHCYCSEDSMNGIGADHKAIAAQFLALYNETRLSVQTIAKRIDADHHLKEGGALAVYFHLVAVKAIAVDAVSALNLRDRR